MKHYQVYDNKARHYIMEPILDVDKIMIFQTQEDAENWKDADLDIGNYPDEPHTVYTVHEFENGLYSKEVF